MTKTCEQCFSDYEAGYGVTQDDSFPRNALPERFCSDACADEYDRDYEMARHGDGEGTA